MTASLNMLFALSLLKTESTEVPTLIFLSTTRVYDGLNLCCTEVVANLGSFYVFPLVKYFFNSTVVSFSSGFIFI